MWQSLGQGGAFITRAGGKRFTLATGEQATLKADAERLRDHPEIIARLLGLYAVHPCIKSADALSFVPNGVAEFTDQLSELTGKQVVRLFRPEGAPRTDIQFRSPKDEALARQVGSICEVEDISRTGFSAHATAYILRLANPELDIHSLSMLQRDQVEPRYQEGPAGVAYHTFVRRDIPLEVDEFAQQYPDIPVQIVP